MHVRRGPDPVQADRGDTDIVTVDVARLRAVLEFVTANPERWDQGNWYRLPDEAYVEAEPGTDWTCGTTACVAGWTAIQAGYVPTTNHLGRSVLIDPNAPGLELRVADVATDLLGLTYEQSDLLFFADNTLRDVWEFARVFTDGEIRVPPEVADGELNLFDPEDEVDGYYESLAD